MMKSGMLQISYIYAALSEKVKEKQREIMKQAEILLHERKKIKR